MGKICGKTECPCYDNNSPVFDPIRSGKDTPKIVLLTDAPESADTRRIFSGEQTQFMLDALNQMEVLTAAGSSFICATAIRCKADLAGMSESTKGLALKCCKEFFVAKVKAWKPKLIVSFGSMSLTQSTRMKGIKDKQGILHYSEELQCHVLPMYAAGYLLRNMSHEGSWISGFNLIKNFINNDWSPPSDKDKYRTIEVESIRNLFSITQAVAGIAIDTETQGLDWDDPLFTPVSYSLSADGVTGYQIYLFEECPEEEKDYSILWDRKIQSKKLPTLVHVKRSSNFDNKMRELRWFLEEGKIKKIMHNGSYDMHVFNALFRLAGRLCNWPHDKRVVDICGYDFDTQNAAQLLNENMYAQCKLETLQKDFSEVNERYDSETFQKNADKSDMLSVPREPLTKYSCLHKDSLVYLPDGTLVRIDKLVRSQYSGDVISYNVKENKIEPKKVTGWVENKREDLPWFKIITSSTQRQYNKKTMGPAFTEDHLICTQYGDVRVDALIPMYHKIVTPEAKFSNETMALLLGSLLGDGYLGRRNTAGAGYIFSQNKKRMGLIHMVQDAFPDGVLQNTTKETMVQVVVPYKQQFSDMIEDLDWTIYAKGRRKLLLTDKVIPLLTPLSLAFWYCSDGTLTKDKTPRIYQYYLTEQQLQGCTQWLNSMGIVVKAHLPKKEGDRNSFFFIPPSHRDNFFTVIAPYIPEDLQYKVPKEYHHLCGTYKNKIAYDGCYATPIREVRAWNPCPASIRGYRRSFCLQVEDNHNFLTSVGFVHNCMDTIVTKQVSVPIRKQITESMELDRYMRNMVMPTIHTLNRMEQVGAWVNTQALEKATIEVTALRDSEHQEALDLIPGNIRKAHESSGLRLSRTALVKDALYSELGFKVKPINTTKTGEPSTDQDTLTLLRDKVKNKKVLDFIHHYTEYRKYDTLAGRYLKGFSEHKGYDGRIHTSFSLCKATTGRVACLTGDTPIYVLDSREKVAIKDIKAGDWVWSFNDALKPVPAQVSWSGKTIENAQLLTVSYQKPGDSYVHHIRCTWKHQFRLVDGAYVEARNLKEFDQLLTISEASPKGHSEVSAQVVGVHWSDTWEDVYDLTVPAFSNFIANGVCVHNSSGPNLQNIPNRGEAAAVVRRIIAAPPGKKILKADASQAELRWMGHMAQDPAMMKIFIDGILDIHTATAIDMTNFNDPHAWDALSPKEQSSKRKTAKPVNFGYCLRKGTQIITYEGIKPIEDICVGDYVLTHKKRWRRVTDIQSPVATTLYRIVTRTGKIVECTPDHMMLCHFPSANGREGRQGFVPACDLRIGDYLVHHGTVLERSTDVANGLTQEDARIIGWYVSEGSYANYSFHISQSRAYNPVICKHMDELLNPLGVTQNKDNICYSGNSPKLREILDRGKVEYALKSQGINIDSSLWESLPVTIRVELIAGLWDGDGSVVTQNDGTKLHITYVSASIGLLQSIQKILDSLGINSKISKYNDRIPSLRIVGSVSKKRFLEIIPTHKKGKADNYSPKKQFASEEAIESIIIIPCTETVYDFTVEEDHSFVANGLFTHNCYGMHPTSLITYAKVEYGVDITEEEALAYYEAYFKKYNKLPVYYDKMVAYGQKHGYVKSALGRRRRLPELNSNNRGLFSQAKRQAINFPIQSASSDSVLLAANEIMKMKLPQNEFRLILFIHDELVAEVNENCDIGKYAKIMKDAIENPPLKKLFGVELSVPMVSEVQFGDNLNDCTDWIFT